MPDTENRRNAGGQEFRGASFLTRYRPQVDAYLRGLFDSRPGLPTTMVEYHMGFRDATGSRRPEVLTIGKGIRSSLVLLTAHATGGEWQRAIPAAAAIELVHNSSLIIDDIQDKDDTRRGIPTVRKIWEDPQAINGGIQANTLGSQALNQLRQNGHSADTVLRAQELLLDATIDLYRGQSEDITMERNTAVTIDDYMRMSSQKTGAMLETAIELGMLLGSPEQQTIKQLRIYGKTYGLAFQYHNDYMGMWGDPKKTGKEVDSDIRRKKMSLPIIIAFNQVEDSAKTYLEDLYRGKRKPDDNDIRRVYNILEEIDCKGQMLRILASSGEQAAQAIEESSLDEGFKQDYLWLNDQLVP